MSMVYEAEDTRIGRRVALKVISAPLSLDAEQRAAMIARLKREARAIARLSHPNIVTVFDIGEDDGQHFIVMEFLEGLTLRERIAEGPLPLAEVAAILDGVASGLDAVHAAGIVHRDIKPSNVMLLPNGAVKLLDFGVARQLEDTMVTQAGSIVGSPTYMAPEQTEGEESSAATDLWSLGVTLYEMLAGRPPFVGENIPRILYQVVHEKPSTLPQVTPAVREVLNRALEKKPERRYRSARQLADAFRAALPRPVVSADDSIPAPRVSATPEPARVRPVQDKRPLLWGAGLLLLLAALPTALHLHHAPAPSGRQAPAVSHAVSRSYGAPQHRLIAPASPPVVRAASSHQHRVVRRPKYTPRRVAEAATQEAVVPVTRVHSRPAVGTSSARVIEDRLPARPSRRFTRPRRLPRPLAHAPTPVPKHGDSERLDTTRTASSTPSVTASPELTSAPSKTSAPNLTGTWHGTLTNHRATLVISRHEGSSFEGMMSVHTGGRDARVAVTGQVSPRTGRISMRETKRLPGTAANAWDLGTESGQVKSGGRISGMGTDVRGRSGEWSFTR